MCTLLSPVPCERAFNWNPAPPLKNACVFCFGFEIEKLEFECIGKSPANAATAGSMRRGGNRNQKKDVIDIEYLVDQWVAIGKQHDGLFNNFGDYRNVWGECAPRTDLVNLLELLVAIQKVSPGMNVGYGDLKECASLVFQSVGGLKPKPHQTLSENASWVADKMVVAQKHCRALAFNKGWKENLEKFLDKLPQGKKARFASFVDDLKEGNEKQESPQKKLKAEADMVSPVTKDEFGLPVVGLSQGSGSGDELLEGLEKGPLPSRKKDIRALFKKPSCKEKGEPSKCKKTKSMKKQPAQSKPKKAEVKATPPGTKLYITRGSLQSYITAQEPGQSKKHLWVAITKAQTTKHTAIAEQIYLANPTSKQKALDMREKLLAKG